MTAKIIDGAGFAANVRERVAASVDGLKKEHGIVPGLAVLLVGDDPASEVYVRNKGRQTLAAGMSSFEHRLPADISEAQVLARIEHLNADPSVHGILVQLPLPEHLNKDVVINTIDPAKDVDGFHVTNVGRLGTGQKTLVPCTPLGCLLLLKQHFSDLTGKNAVVVGCSNIVGKPMAQLLLQEQCTVSMAHEKTQNIEGLCRSADILVVAVGKPKLVKQDWIKEGAVVIDVGINRTVVDGKQVLVGDVDFQAVSKRAGAITPVPGGVGPMTIAYLLVNTLTACCRASGLPEPDWFAA